jgi:peptidoglycan/LPS O-acetylase OafA/YrhL
VGFGLAAGALVKRTAADQLDRFMQWSALSGFVLVFSAQYFSNIPFSIYPKSDFWRDSPGLILIRVGIMLLMMAGAYLWTEFGMGNRWSWMLCLGKTSLMVYWVHVMLVYGDVAKPLKRALSIPGTALATLLVTLSMVALAAVWLWWKARRAPAANVAAAS